MHDVVIAAAARTPIGRFQGALSSVAAVELGATVLRALISRCHVDPTQIDEVIMGQVLTAGAGQNPARQASIGAGLASDVPAMTLNKVCGSGLKAIHLAIQAIRCGDADLILAGGMENMSSAPYALPGARAGLRLGHGELKDTLISDGLWDAFGDYHMGETAEILADRYAITRAAQDEFALASQQKACAAIDAGRFDNEIVPVSVAQREGDPVTVTRDEQPNSQTTIERLAALKPAFRKNSGTVTAGNASSLNDGAAGVLVVSATRAKALGLPVLARITGYANAAVEPEVMGLGAAAAAQHCLAKSGLALKETDLIEANEAFASQSLAVGKELDWQADRVNVNGGAIALGHPIGASGARIVVTLLHELARCQARTGLATLCIGGGQGVALVVTRD